MFELVIICISQYAHHSILFLFFQIFLLDY